MFKMVNYLNYFFIYVNKKIKIGYKYSAGRNNLGVICVRHKVTGNKNKHLNLDFFRRINSYGCILKIIYTPNRTAYLGSIVYSNGLFSYIILSANLKVGDIIYSGSSQTIVKSGNTALLKNIKLFNVINNIELYPNSGFNLARSAGEGILITVKNKTKVILKLKSG
jgi:ribosomal protein L2